MELGMEFPGLTNILLVPRPDGIVVNVCLHLDKPPVHISTRLIDL